MSLDYRKNTYRPNRPDTRLRTTYGTMSEWIRDEASKARARRPGVPAGLLAQANPSPAFAKKRTRPQKRGQQQYVYMRHGVLDSDPRFEARRAALDDQVPIHLRYADDCGYDDFHKAYRAAVRLGPKDMEFPLFGPPRLRHGRQGGSWRHVKEVLQAGGSRIVFVDGQVSTTDTLRIDDVPGGHLILPEDHGPKLNRDLDNMLNLRSSPRILSARETLRATNYGALTAQKGMEQNNWNIIR